jgi:hypothetical protein
MIICYYCTPFILGIKAIFREIKKSGKKTFSISHIMLLVCNHVNEFSLVNSELLAQNRHMRCVCLRS